MITNSPLLVATIGIIVAFVVVVALVSRKQRRDRAGTVEEMTRQVSGLGFDPNMMIVTVDGTTLALDSGRTRLLVADQNGHRILTGPDILDVKIDESRQINQQLSGPYAGAGAGVGIGIGTGSGETNSPFREVMNSLSMTILTRDVDRPTVLVNFMTPLSRGPRTGSEAHIEQVRAAHDWESRIRSLMTR